MGLGATLAVLIILSKVSQPQSFVFFFDRFFFPLSGLIVVGLGATLAVLITLGKVSQQELNKMADSPDSPPPAAAVPAVER